MCVFVCVREREGGGEGGSYDEIYPDTRTATTTKPPLALHPRPLPLPRDTRENKREIVLATEREEGVTASISLLVGQL